MRKLHRSALSGASSALAGLALAAGTALSAAPAGATATALMDFPPGSSTGEIASVNSGKCLEPSRANPFGNGDIIEQHTCNGTAAQAWQLVPIGTRTFISTTISGNPFQVTHPAYRIVNAASGLCLDDRNGATNNGAIVQEWACNTTSTTMQWGGFSDSRGQNLIANLRASFSRAELMTLEVVSGSTEENVPVQLFNAPTPPPAFQEWSFRTPR
jgi:hypothetical protein